MKKLLTILILLLTVASQGWAGTEILSNFSTVNVKETTFSVNEGKWTFSQLAGAWVGGIQYYPENDIWAYRLVVTTESDADLKIAVEYEDGMSMEFSDAQATNQRILNLEHSKKITKIFIQDKTGGLSGNPNVIVFTSISYDDEIDATAETGKTKVLDCFTPYSGAEYSDHKFTGANYNGMQYWIGDDSNIHNSSIKVQTGEDKKLEIGIEYTDGWYAKYQAESSSFNISIDPNRNIKKLEIKNNSGAAVSGLEFTEILISNEEGASSTIPKYSIKSGFTGTDENKIQTYTVSDETDLYAKDLYLKFNSSITAQIEVTYADSDTPVEYANIEAQERHLKLNSAKKLKEIKVISTSPIEWSGEDMYVGEEESNELEMPTTLTLSWTGTQALSGTPVTVAASEFSSVTAGTKVQLTVNADGTMNVAIPNTETVLINGQVRAGGSYFEVTAGNIDALKANGISITGSGTTLTAIGTSTYTTATITLSGDNPLSCGWSSSYNTSNNTVTITSAWGARGWFVGNDQYNDKKCITVNFAESGVSASGSLKMEYISANGVLTSTEASIATTDTKVSLDIPESIVRIVQVYFTSVTANATYQLSSVEVEEKATDNRTEKTLVTANVVCDNDEGATEAIPGYKFKNAVAGDELVVHVSGVQENAYISAKYPVGNYPSILGNTYSTAVDGGDSECRIPLTTDIITSLKAKGLIICGKNLTIGVVALYTESALGTESDTRTFTYNISPEGSGTVEVRIGGTDGEITTETSFLQGTQLTVTAKPNNGYQFVKWNEDNTTDATFVCTLEDNIQKTAVFASTPVFDANGKADLSKFVSDGVADYSYAEGKGTIATGEGETYKGVILNLGSDDYVSGTKMIFKFQLETSAQIHVNYVGAEWGDGAQVSTTGTEIIVPLDYTKQVNRIDVQLLNENATAVLTEVSVSDKCTLTVSAPATYGSVAVKQGQTPTTATEFDYNTSLTLTATPASSDYSFKQWVIGETTQTANPYTFTITGDTEITAEFKETPLTAGDTRTLWVNADGTDVSWNEIGTQGATLGAILEVGEKILVTVKSVSTTQTDRQVCLRDANSEIVTGFSSFDEVTAYPYVAKFTLTSDYVDKLKNGFHISGTNTTVTKMELYKPLPDTRTEKNLYGEAAMDSTSSDGITIAAEKFANISEDDVLIIYLSNTKATDFITLRETANWTQLTSSYKEPLTVGQKTFTLTLNDVNVAKLKAGGLNLTGGNFTITKMTIKTNGEIPADEGGEEEGGDEEAIIDKKTGEADLNELSAQDDTKTTLTQNEDGSITMTTTEAYQAAQIWFNNPEEVAGNVLKVQLAESSVNVTVTVKYTDGTQSQMSANTMAAKARGAVRAATRADSGTEIEVPLETGKEVQNIEVKNNVAGTITIQKMQVTTINVFTNGVANLSMLKPQSNATYDTSTHTLATTKGWTGATISPVDGEKVSGKELLIEFAEAAKVKVAVKYRTDVEGPSIIMEKAAANVRLALDNTKSIQEISIQPTDAAIVTFTKIAVNGEESDDGKLKPGKSITLWENSAGEKLAWNEVGKQGEDIGEMLQEYDELLITVSGVAEDCDWPKVFLRDANSEQVGNEVLLNDVASFPYTVRIVLTGDMAEQLANGFCVCGDGITVTKLVAYRPEEPKEGDIHLADLNYGYNSSYDKGTHTITTTSRWAARGWEIGDKRYNDKNLIIVKFEPVDFPVTLKMEYTAGVQTAQATSVGVPAGRTELMLEIPQGISKLNRVYLIYEEPGSLRLTEASVVYQDKLKLSTAIQAFEAEGVIRDGRYDTGGWYNLRGMRIQEPKTSGVYIHGGKKVVIY